MCDNKIFVIDQTKLADNINQLPPFDIEAPESGVDFEAYSAYLQRIDGWRQKVIDWALTKLPGSIVMADGEVFFTRGSLRNALAHGKGKRFYDNEFITKVKAADGLDYSQGPPATRRKPCAHPSTGSILQNILNVK
jgi:hypothetical protein